MAKQKSFFFKDYQEQDINFDDTNKKTIKISLNRISFLFSFFFFLILIFSIKIIYLSLFPEKKTQSQNMFNDLIKKRADIIDRNGIILARSIDIYSAGIRPKLVKNKKKLLINLKLSSPDLDIKRVEEKLNSNNFFYIKKRLTEEEKTKLWLIGNKAIEFEKKQLRIYPQQNLSSHILGQIDDNNNGISGVEKFFDNHLKSKKIINSSLHLTIDSNLQHLIRQELLNAKEDFKQIGSAALLMNIDKGEILSLVSLPDYDLNKRVSISNDMFSNKITKGVYELGSVFKTFTLAAALENKTIKTNTDI